MNENERDEKLENIIKELCTQQALNDAGKDIISQLESIYKENNGKKYRHKYSKITEIILNASQEQEQTLMIISQNLRGLKKSIGDKDNEFKIQFAKLYDHINLECIRLRDIDGKISEVKNATKESKQKLQQIQQ